MAHDDTSKPPVVYIFFNRPQCVRHSFRAIRDYRPSRLHLVSDGPRDGRADDKAAKQACNDIIHGMLDWPCEVIRHDSEVNLGCGRRISSALTEIFAVEECAMVIEDDCIPGPSFFRFMEQALHRYRDDEEVMLVSGSPPLGRSTRKPVPGEVRYSRYWSAWGWGTWSRFWKTYDFHMAGLEDWHAAGGMDAVLSEASEKARFISRMRAVANGELDTWDYQVQFNLWRRQGYCIESAVNLVRNVGFDANATHTTARGCPHSFRTPHKVCDFIFPPDEARMVQADERNAEIARWVRGGPTKWEKAAASLRRHFWMFRLGLI